MKVDLGYCPVQTQSEWDIDLNARPETAGGINGKHFKTQDTGREKDFLGRTEIAQEIIPREKELCEIKIFFLHSQRNNQQS